MSVKALRYLSLCSGIEAATAAWHSLGWQAVAYSEIDPFASAVLAHHYPHTPNWGDMTKFQGWPDATVDVLVGGTPCQSFSVAGLRAGLADPRGGLMLTFLAIAQRYRPEWVVWENVPGVLSSAGGRDFGSLLGGLAELGYGFAFRVLDAQFFGVAQRRRRVFVVANARDWRRAAAVLFDSASLRGDPAPRREAGEGVAGAVTRRIDRGGVNSEGNDGHLIPQPHAAISPALKARDSKGVSSDGDGDGDGDGAILVPMVAHSLRGSGFDASEDGTGRGTPLVPVAFQSNANANDGIGQDLAPTLRTGTGGKHGNPPAVAAAMQVRRLTPRECERLQGFEDDYTAIPYRGKPAADGPRYKALGNSMAVPVMAWIGRRIQMVSDATQPATEEACA